MKQYKNKSNGKKCEIVDFIAVGMCKHTLGYTFVVFKYENSELDFNFVMTQSEFLKEHEEVKSKKK